MTEAKRPAPKDIAIVSGPTEDGQGARVLRIREGDVSAGEIRPVREGEPINHAEVVRLHPLDAGQRVCEVEVLHAPKAPNTGDESDGPARASAKPTKPSTSSGPARVSNAKYRKNWSAIFGDANHTETDWSIN